jgi:hypothetical protein
VVPGLKSKHISSGAREFSSPKASAGKTKDISRAYNPPAMAAGTALIIKASLFVLAQSIPTDSAMSSLSWMELSCKPKLEPQRSQCAKTAAEAMSKARE